MNRKRTIITGGAGFLGSHLCDRLIASGYEVLCIDNLITGSISNIAHLLKTPNFQFLKTNTTNPHLRKKLPLRIDIIFDLASPASPKDFSKFPLEILRTSSIGTENMLEVSKATGARILHTSTSEVYGDPLVHPQKEGYWGNVNPYGPRSCYDEGKRYAEALIYSYRKKYRVQTQIVRIFNTYGPRMRPDDGRVVSNFIMQALSGKPLTVYGDGSHTRSFCYIDDMIDGILEVMRTKTEGPINLGNPAEFTVKELAQKVLAMTASTSNTLYKPLPKDDPKQRRPDITLAKKLLRWQPKISLDEGLRRTIEWFSDRKLP